MCIVKRNLKKQSQYAVRQIGVNSYLKGDYEQNSRFGLEKNKANSKPISDEATTD